MTTKTLRRSSRWANGIARPGSGNTAGFERALMMALGLAIVSGAFAGCAVGYIDNPSSDPIDACIEVTCSGHGVCDATSGSAVCDCDQGYEATGLSCVAVAGPCAGVTCSNHGVCDATSGSAVCDCDQGYQASDLSCVAVAGPCSGVTCSGHGTCVVTSGSASCDCDQGYEASGLSCVELVGPGDPCDGVTCSGHGTCEASSGAPQCQCDSGYYSVGVACLPDITPCTYLDCEVYKACGSGSGGTLYVDAAYSGAQSGTVLEPFKTVQAAINAANSRDAIHVAGGNYVESIQVSKKEVHLCGGWSSGFSERDPSTHLTTITSASSSKPTVSLSDSRQTTVVGFRIRGGDTGIRVSSSSDSRSNSDPRISDNIIEESGVESAVENKKAGVVLEGGYITLSGNIIQDNVGGKGGALALHGREAVVQGNAILNNKGGSDHGGAIYAAISNLILEGNLVKGNAIGTVADYGWGGGMCVFGRALLRNNVWTDNAAPSYGGALFVDEASETEMFNDIFYNNRCTTKDGGTAIAVDARWDGYRSILVASHITVSEKCSGRSAIVMDATSQFTLTNSIVWSASGTPDFSFRGGNSTINVSYSAFLTSTGDGKGGNVLNKGPGNIHVDPLFANPGAADFHLRSTGGRFDSSTGTWVIDTVHSPAIDAGDPSSPYDLESAPAGGRVNLGAYGNTPQASRSN